MASVEDRWYRQVRLPDGTSEKQRTDRYGIGLRWLVRWREPDGRPRKQSFAKRVDADTHAAAVEADKARGVYRDARAGRELFGDYATRWLEQQTTDLLTRENIAARMRRYVEPYPLWRTPLNRVKPSTVQAWLRELASVTTSTGSPLAASTRGVVFSHVSAILNAAVEDDVIAKNPCRSSSVRPPRPDARKVSPWPREWVTGMHTALPERYRVLVTLGAGLGLRQGELFGLAVDDVDFLRGWVEVRRQVRLVTNRLCFSLPKGRKVRRVPLPSSVRDELAAHLAAYPAKDVALPWDTPDGQPVTARLVVTTRESGAVQRNHFNGQVWRKAQAKIGIPPERQNGCHALRHFYASVLLDAGESVKAVSDYLGHASATVTLSTYAHVMPSSESRTRSAVDSVLMCPQSAPREAVGGVTSTDSQNSRNSSGSMPRSAS